MRASTAPIGTRSVDVWRVLTAAGALVSAAVHLWQYAAGYSDVSVIGPLFLVNTVAGVILCLLVLAWRHPLSALLAAGFGAVTAAAYWYSVLFGLFGFQETLMGGTPIVLAEVAEYVTLICGLTAASMMIRHDRSSGGEPAR